MRKLSEFNVHIYENEPSMEDVYPAFIVFNRISNFSQINFIHEANENTALFSIHEREVSETIYDEDTEQIELSVEQIEIDEEGIQQYLRANNL